MLVTEQEIYFQKTIKLIFYMEQKLVKQCSLKNSWNKKSIAQKHNSFLGQDIVGLCCITYEYAKTENRMGGRSLLHI